MLNTVAAVLSPSARGSDDGQQLQLLVALAARRGGVDQQVVGLERVEQRLAVQFQRSDARWSGAAVRAGVR
ncbi:hypothetical protein SK803_00800 [Lentzea sp. BCCO 10_0856]|uniref:Uncharacterized protein n=1 Tax=Lentzea miocenica TaxID=3095431 RepID=A0ABU4SSC4_9PSEU|nr:hypothetical protein [Lentzea sp. BCCO 10_0856]MDX8028722.1 hypothetical protein [Lentzea sp. BCCO 10_0856]